MKALGEFLRPEFLNRVDEIISFNHLSEENFRAIAGIMLAELRDSLAERGLSFTWDEALGDYLYKEGLLHHLRGPEPPPDHPAGSGGPHCRGHH